MNLEGMDEVWMLSVVLASMHRGCSIEHGLASGKVVDRHNPVVFACSVLRAYRGRYERDLPQSSSHATSMSSFKARLTLLKSYIIASREQRKCHEPIIEHDGHLTSG